MCSCLAVFTSENSVWHHVSLSLREILQRSDDGSLPADWLQGCVKRQLQVSIITLSQKYTSQHHITIVFDLILVTSLYSFPVKNCFVYAGISVPLLSLPIMSSPALCGPLRRFTAAWHTFSLDSLCQHLMRSFVFCLLSPSHWLLNRCLNRWKTLASYKRGSTQVIDLCCTENPGNLCL